MTGSTIPDLGEGLLLGAFEVRAARYQLDKHLVQAPAALLCEAGDVGVKLGGHPQDDVAAVGLLGHLDDGTASGTMCKSIGLAVSHHPALYSRRFVR